MDLTLVMRMPPAARPRSILTFGRWITLLGGCDIAESENHNSASRKCGLDADKELAYRQQAANLIQDMGQRLQYKPDVSDANFKLMSLRRLYPEE
ncbi:hypothetical protein MSG28_015125 [Choristoneura fumiferana]|uniref:Uncharacterized protein n=1 Tax=Choristoneura fumiferana TaxID=7141 RepID=A0ACC0KZK5_CHOFU|nr:hypothetical protein MSG28_015125 [Choristoneura fumiferana]